MPQTLLRDSDIRRPLHRWLEDQPHESPTSIVHELKLLRPTARVDIAVINGELSGFEIKSDVDTLSRLPRQVASFSAFFDRVCVVTTSRHAAAAAAVTPSWWDIVVAAVEGGKYEPIFVRQGARNPAPNNAALLAALTKEELRTLLLSSECPLASKSRKAALVAAALEHIESETLRGSARDLLRARRLRGDQSVPSPQTTDPA